MERFGMKKSPIKVAKCNLVDPSYAFSSKTNPFDSDDELDHKQVMNPSNRTTCEPVFSAQNFSTNPFDDDSEDERKGTSSYSLSSVSRRKYKNDFSDSGGLEDQSIQDLENYAVYKSEETTQTVNSCLKIAEDIRDGAAKTSVTLHQQGEQITRSHYNAVDIDQNLSRGEKLLGSLGGIFSKTWKPKKNHPIKGPVITRDESFVTRNSHLEQRERLGLVPVPKGRPRAQTRSPEPTTALHRVEVEKAKQDDGLSNLGNLLGELKNMAIDIGSEIDRQNKALDHFYDDVDELHFRMKNANQRGRRLLGK